MEKCSFRCFMFQMFNLEFSAIVLTTDTAVSCLVFWGYHVNHKPHAIDSFGFHTAFLVKAGAPPQKCYELWMNHNKVTDSWLEMISPSQGLQQSVFRRQEAGELYCGAAWLSLKVEQQRGFFSSGSSLMETGQHCSKRDELEQNQWIFSTPWQCVQVCRVARKRHKQLYAMLHQLALGKSDWPVWNVKDKRFSQINVGMGITFYGMFCHCLAGQGTGWNHVREIQNKRNTGNRHKCYLNAKYSSFSLKGHPSVNTPPGSRLTYKPEGIITISKMLKQGLVF